MKTIAAVFVVVMTVLACGGGSSSGIQPKDTLTGTEFGYDSVQPPTDTGADRPACPARLSFVEEKDDLGQSTKGATVYNILISFSEMRELKVAYKACDTPVQGAAVTFVIENDPQNTCSLGSAMAYTDENGVASTKLTNVKQLLAQFQVKVCVDGEADVPCLYFNVAIDPKGFVPLTVTFAEYKGAYPLIDNADVLLYKQGVNGKPKCADLKLDALPTAAMAKSSISLTSAAKFEKLKDLETEKKQTYTILGVARQGTGPIQAYACDDVKGVVEWGGQTHVELTLKDLAPRLAGSYEITSTFDLVSGLPPQVANVVYAITGFFQNPTAELMLLICKSGGSSGTLHDFCGYLFQDPSNPDIKQLTGTGEVVSQILNAVLIALLESNCPYKDDPSLCGKIYWTAKDISDILTKFQLISTFTFLKEPDEQGALPETACSESWHSVRLRWTLGKNCPPDDDNCGWQKFSFNLIPGIEAVISGHFTAKLEPPAKGEPWRLSIDKHKLNLKYGALVDFAIEKWLLPMLFGDGSDGLPAVDSYEYMIGSLLAGKACLADMSCCETFAQNVSNQTSGVAKNLVQGACEALIQTGSNWLRNQLMGLDATPDNFSIGTKAPCPIYDKNKDMKFDAIGSKEAQCEWDSTLVIGGGSYSPVGTFYGNVK